MKMLDHQARSNVLKQLIQTMSHQMASRTPQGSKALHVEIKHGGAIEPADVEPDECPHCDGEGCRFCR